MDAPSAQLHQELRNAVTDALSTRRPLLHHLSADTAWLLQLPRPQQATRRGGRLYFNILIDPWLSGTQTDVTSWLSTQWHATRPRVPNIAAVEQLLREVEILGASTRLSRARKSNVQEMEESGDLETYIDAVAISHEFTDHCHQKTLLEVHPDVPVFAAEKAVSLIDSWDHFRLVQRIPNFRDDPDWHATSMYPLPEWLGISRLITNGDMGLFFHSAILIAFNSNMGMVPSRSGKARQVPEDESAEAVIYTPHGIHSDSDDLNFVATADPPIKTLALLHGLEYITLGAVPLNLGAHNGLRAQRILKAHYWIGTHDEHKSGTGIVGWLLRRRKISLKDAVREELNRRDGKRQLSIGRPASPTTDVLGSFSGVNWTDLGNGESLVLE
ncbi:hypothetical protein AAFC00_003147 [Neodothiora populina]|uniref:Uncharacterized protein n=1 Tax=Neodothiora populina TaxID=2781224 RepID=A0ABR3P9V1_9PEZI